MDNRENSEENEHGSSDQHSFYSDGRDESYEPPPDEILENVSELSSSRRKTQRLNGRESHLCACQEVRASQDTVYEVTRSNLNDDRNRLTSSSDDNEDNIPLYMLRTARRVSTPNRRSKYKKRYPFKPSIIWKHIHTHPLYSSITCCNHWDKIRNNLRGSTSNALVHLRNKHMDM